MPTLGRAKAAAHSAVCKSNLRQLAIAMRLYLDEQKAYPDPRRLPRQAGMGFDALRAFSPTPRLTNELFCPADKATKRWLELNPWRMDMLQAMWGLLNCGYNTLGSASQDPTRGHRGDLGLAWEPRELVNGAITCYTDRPPPPCQEADAEVPSDMIVFGDHFMFSKVRGYIGVCWQLRPTKELFSLTNRHNQAANIAFCDGHIEYARAARWRERTDAAVRRWNRDHEPHSETWSGLGTPADCE